MKQPGCALVLHICLACFGSSTPHYDTLAPVAQFLVSPSILEIHDLFPPSTSLQLSIARVCHLFVLSTIMRGEVSKIRHCLLWSQRPDASAISSYTIVDWIASTVVEVQRLTLHPLRCAIFILARPALSLETVHGNCKGPFPPHRYSTQRYRDSTEPASLSIELTTNSVTFSNMA